MCVSTCFGRFLAHHQEFATALAASGFTANAPVVKPEAANAVADDDGRGSARNMLSHT